ncbi:hypothetical protein KY340_00520 [Candidatus Woesearchaeota archaeon]|nr:hypothetical protein [Candidatus Woesearchaeota archaeon]
MTVPNANQKLATMRQHICDRLDETGEFCIIEPQYRFNTSMFPNVQGNVSSLVDRLNQQRKRHIFAVKREDDTRYLVICNVTHYPTNDYHKKLLAAGAGNIHTCHILFRGHQGEGDEFFRQESAHGQNRYSTRHVGLRAGIEIVWMKRMERDLKSITLGLIPYYQSERIRIGPAIRLYKPEDVELEYRGHEFARDHTSEVMYQMVMKEEMEKFSLRPFRFKDEEHRRRYQNWLAGELGIRYDRSHLFKFARPISRDEVEEAPEE